MPDFKEKQSEVAPRPEKAIITDLAALKEVVPREEIKSWIQKVEEDPVVQTIHDDKGQPVLAPAKPTNPTVTIPATKTAFLAGFRKTASEAGKWWSVFLLRLIRIKEGNVIFKKEND